MYKEIIVVKVGTNVMTNKNNRIVRPVLRSLVKQIAELYERDIITILVSSGSVIAGKEVLGRSKIKDKTQRRQVYSAIGQPRMMRLYYNIFLDYGLKCAQVLPTKRDFSTGIHRENMINCYEGLLSEGVIPILNEDDAVSVTMSMFSDNDELASLVAQLINADKLIILTDIDGLYSGHPDSNTSKLIAEVGSNENIDQYIKESKKGEAEGRGGMGSKLNYAKQAASNNIPTFIANGKTDNTIIDIIDGKTIGTKVTL
ncbi:MAG: glutamate 5-kinase [Flavobacteriales bacterium]|nr:glutamate 5-kinase [Flavobacteriia bacterium]NCP06483.1 glutamate 5-kinase [Flavobacteriales bacterium]PIV94425.1 MAG: glutamate 5-kinase [Flavobacteriaceae bacterium CG17_big_fil_post_rev_8_21_14_2_50_33_15]PIY10436.1 MAG: glutamate 5-kinase [Flavobacteriaceae bacterium CG_4_10_14_3_um_filter_33_47]PJB17606.1 MAG: glutamate 5-kinase [Flavobacteriaceae bacterium CG_4_9_14_3_um_filter_33_16]